MPHDQGERGRRRIPKGLTSALFPFPIGASGTIRRPFRRHVPRLGALRFANGTGIVHKGSADWFAGGRELFKISVFRISGIRSSAKRFSSPLRIRGNRCSESPHAFAPPSRRFRFEVIPVDGVDENLRRLRSVAFCRQGARAPNSPASKAMRQNASYSRTREISGSSLAVRQGYGRVGCAVCRGEISIAGSPLAFPKGSRTFLRYRTATEDPWFLRRIETPERIPTSRPAYDRGAQLPVGGWGVLGLEGAENGDR